MIPFMVRDAEALVQISDAALQLRGESSKARLRQQQ